jgi:hypothetical protein
MMSDVQTRFHLDGDGDHFTLEHVQDVAPILERNARLRAEPQRSDWGRHIASIPNVVLVRWMNEDGVNPLGMSSEEWGHYIRRKLDDPDWRQLRVDR